MSWVMQLRGRGGKHLDKLSFDTEPGFRANFSFQGVLTDGKDGTARGGKNR